ncbi:MAG: archaetidylserine decarboxylase [Pseudomonadota bacterium]
MFDKFYTFLQSLLPQHTLSRLAGLVGNCRWFWLKNSLIFLFMLRYRVDLAIAEKTKISDYATFNEFFARRLNASARPIASDENIIIFPVDGVISQIGDITAGKLLQAKGKNYSLIELLTRVDLAAYFEQGRFATIYINPSDYHRVHMPFSGKLLEMIYVPGTLFSVNSAAVQSVPWLFARNERIVSLFETSFGYMAVIMVGAMLVGGLQTVWTGKIRPHSRKTIQKIQYYNQSFELPRGAEMGHFEMGSTVILLCSSSRMVWNQALHADMRVQIGQGLGIQEI